MASGAVLAEVSSVDHFAFSLLVQEVAQGNNRLVEWQLKSESLLELTFVHSVTRLAAEIAFGFQRARHSFLVMFVSPAFGFLGDFLTRRRLGSDGEVVQADIAEKFTFVRFVSI